MAEDLSIILKHSLIHQLEEEAAKIAADREEEIEAAWWQLATVTKEFAEQTSDAREKCSILEKKVMANRERVATINLEIEHLKVRSNIYCSGVKP